MCLQVPDNLAVRNGAAHSHLLHQQTIGQQLMRMMGGGGAGPWQMFTLLPAQVWFVVS